MNEEQTGVMEINGHTIIPDGEYFRCTTCNAMFEFAQYGNEVPCVLEK